MASSPAARGRMTAVDPLPTFEHHEDLSLLTPFGRFELRASVVAVYCDAEAARKPGEVRPLALGPRGTPREKE